jgi:hypothetical protein
MYLKLHSKYYGPFRVIARIGPAAYTILFREGCKLPTFHVTQLKKHSGKYVIPSPHLDSLMKMGTSKLLRKLIPRVQGNISITVVRWLVKWVNLPQEAATWKDATFVQKIFPEFRSFEDKSGPNRGELSELTLKISEESLWPRIARA